MVSVPPSEPVRDASITDEQADLLAAKLDEQGFPRKDGYGRTLSLSMRLAMAVGLAGQYQPTEPLDALADLDHSLALTIIGADGATPGGRLAPGCAQVSLQTLQRVRAALREARIAGFGQGYQAGHDDWASRRKVHRG